MARYIETNLPPDLRVKVVHLHRGNSSRSERHGHCYRTIAKIIRRSNGMVVGLGEARCSHRDRPSRSTGRQVAVGRAMKDAEQHTGVVLQDPPF